MKKSVDKDRLSDKRLVDLLIRELNSRESFTGALVQSHLANNLIELRVLDDPGEDKIVKSACAKGLVMDTISGVEESILATLDSRSVKLKLRCRESRQTALEEASAV